MSLRCDPELLREVHEFVVAVTSADEDELNVVPPSLNDLRGGAKREVDAILGPHDTEIRAEIRLPRAPLGLRGAPPVALGIRACPDDRHLLRRTPPRRIAVSRYDSFVATTWSASAYVARSSRNSMRRRNLEPVVNARAVDLGTEIVLVEHEALAEELERRGQRPVGVGRVARLNHIESLATRGAKDEREGSDPAVDELPGVRERAVRRRRWRVLPDSDALDLLEGRIPGTFGANNRHLKARVSQCARFSPHSSVERDRQVVVDDEDALARAA